jgi:hypothetical protein
MASYTNTKARNVMGGDNLFAQKIALLESMYIYTDCGHLCCNILFTALQIAIVKKNLVHL